MEIYLKQNGSYADVCKLCIPIARQYDLIMENFGSYYVNADDAVIILLNMFLGLYPKKDF